MPVRFLTTLDPPPDGFAPARLDKRTLMAGGAVVLVGDLAEARAVVSGLEDRARACVVTVGPRPVVERLGHALWHIEVEAPLLGVLRPLAAELMRTAGERDGVDERLAELELALARAERDLAATRADYNQSVERLRQKVEQTAALYDSLRLTEERFRGLVETSSDWIWEIDAAGVYTYASPKVREILGYDPAEIVGKTPFELMPPDESSRVAALFEERRRLGLPLVAIDNVNLHRDGRTVILETSAVPIRDAKGDFAGYRGVDRDVTERRRAEADRLRLEQQVHQAQKLESLGVLAGGIAHDFNNILTAILGFAEIALLDLPDGSPARESVDKIEHAARRAADLSRQMLAYSGKGRFVVEPLDLGHVVRDMRPLLEASITKRARLSLDVAEPLPAISADATQLRQVVLNLVVNASEALGETDGSIDVSIAARDCTPADFGNAVIGAGPDHAGGRYVVLTVADSGSGMDPLVQSRIFEPFFSTKFTGRGLGLSCVAGIVVGHGGVLQLDSVVGRGSRFTIYLPACDAPIPEPAPGPPAADAVQGTPGRILLVDDEESIRALGAAMLRRLGYEPVLAVDGRDAIERCREPGNGIDCVVLDLTMPRMDGEQTLHEIRRIHPELPVVLSSGYTEASLVGRFDGAGLSGFVQKPYKMAELNAALAAAMGSRPRVRR